MRPLSPGLVAEGLLQSKVGSALCIHHLAGFTSPLEITADFAYLRLRGPGGKYQGLYDN
jgi:hypothetical protein